jgi:hypothetical protein
MLIQQSETTAARRTVYFTAVNTADDSAYTSTLSGADIRISKSGGAEANSTGTATHIATGLFKYEFAVGEVDTLGELSLRLAKTGVYNDVRTINIVAFDPYDGTGLGLTTLDATVSSRLSSSNYAAPTTLLTETDGVETGLTLREALRIVLASAAGRRSGIGTGTELYRDFGNTKSRITMVFDGNGNTTSVTYDPT